MKMWIKKVFLFSIFMGMLALCGCYQSGSDDDLRTIPVTNNPLIIPQHDSGMPAMPGPMAR